MNKQTRRQYVGVALAFLIFGGLIAVATSFLSHAFQDRYGLTATFADARGIQNGSAVQMAGVNVGTIDGVDLAPGGRQAQIKLRIDGKYRIPAGSRFAIKGSLLGNQSTLTVTPAGGEVYYKDGDAVQGDSTDAITDLLNQAPKTLEKTTAELQVTLRESQALLRKFGTTADAVNGLLGDPNSDLRRTLANSRAASEQIPALTEQLRGQITTLGGQANQLLAGVQTSQRNADKVIVGAGRITNSLDATINENRATLRSLLRSADEAASSVAGLTDQVASLLGDPTLRGNLQQTTTNLATISGRLDNAASSLERLASDPRLSSDIRETVGNLRETSTSVRNLAARIETIRIPGERRRPQPGETPPPPPKPLSLGTVALYEPGLALDGSYDTKLERLRLDANYTLLGGGSGGGRGAGGGFYRFGLHDATEGDRLNLQVGRTLGTGTALRYGLVAGKLGGGFDVGSGPLALRFDLFDPNRFTVNARARYYLNPNTAITAGVDAVGKGDRATVGITIRK